MPTEQVVLQHFIYFCLYYVKKEATVQPLVPVQPLVRLPHYLAGTKWSDPLAYSDSVRLSDPQSLFLPQTLNFISPKIKTSLRTKKSCARGNGSGSYNHDVYGSFFYKPYGFRKKNFVNILNLTNFFFRV